jgi:hypothetical protein
MKHHTQDAPSIRNDRPDVPQALLDICAKMMTKNADFRYQSAAEVAEVLSNWLKSVGASAPSDSGVFKAIGAAAKGQKKTGARVLRATRSAPAEGTGAVQVGADPALIDTDPGREAATLKVRTPSAPGSDSKSGSGSDARKRNLPKALSESGGIVLNLDSDSGRGGRKPGDSDATRQAGVSTAAGSGRAAAVGGDAHTAARSLQTKYWSLLAAITAGLLLALLAISFLVK